MQYLLEPPGQSHALGGSHHADGDALLAANLFEKQFKCLPFEFASRVLSGEFPDTSDLLDALALVVDSLFLHTEDACVAGRTPWQPSHSGIARALSDAG